MGFFDKLFGAGGKPAQFDDRVWMNSERKYRDLVVATSQDLREGRLSTIVFHFADTGAEVVDLLKQADLPYALLPEHADFPDGNSSAWQQGAQILVLPASIIPPVSAGKRISPKQQASGPENVVHLAAHHPRLEYDALVLGLDKHWPMVLDFRAYVGLDEPLLEVFGSDRILPMLHQLGMNENEMLNHPMLTRSIESAQKKISKSKKPEVAADTYGEWIRLNT